MKLQVPPKPKPSNLGKSKFEGFGVLWQTTDKINSG